MVLNRNLNFDTPPDQIKVIYSEITTKFCEISTLLLSYVVPVKSKVEISQNFVAFSEYMNFIFHFLKMKKRCYNVMKKCAGSGHSGFLEHKSYSCLDKGKPVNIYTLYGV